MSTADIEAKNFLYKWISPLLLAALIYLALKKYGRVLQDRFKKIIIYLQQVSITIVVPLDFLYLSGLEL